MRHDPREVAAPVGGYSHGLELPPGQRVLFVSGQIPERLDGTVPEAFEDQCHAVWDNVAAVLASAGMGLHDVVKVNTYLTDPGQADTNGRIRRERLGDLRPALTVVVVRTLDPKWLLEIEVTAARPS
jgi:enamine deaminase RidA (YjgF/YER057c/UK114 family)